MIGRREIVAWVLVAALGLALAVSLIARQTAPSVSTYEDCILEHVNGDMSRYVLADVTNACRAKYPKLTAPGRPPAARDR